MVVKDELLEEFDDGASAKDCVREIVLRGETLVRCDKCEAIAIVEKGGAINFYKMEKRWEPKPGS